MKNTFLAVFLSLITASAWAAGGTKEPMRSGATDPSLGAGANGAQGQVGAEPFAALDANADGVISKEEAKEHGLSRNFAQADADRDGRISETEFATWTELQQSDRATGGPAGPGATSD